MTIAAEDIRSSRIFCGSPVMTLRALIFDVDGTLADNEELHRRAFNAAFAEHGLTWHWGRRVYARLAQDRGGKERITDFVGRLRLPADEAASLAQRVPKIHRTKTLLYARLLESGAVLRPGVERLLNAARGAGLKLAVATTTTRENVGTLLDAAFGKSAGPRFDVIAAGDVVERKKPAPDIYHHALDLLGLPARACIAFEDSGVGVRAARAADLFTVVTPTQWTKDDDFTLANVRFENLDDVDGLDGLRHAHAAWLFRSGEAA